MNTAKRFVTRLTAFMLAICVSFLSSCAPKKVEVEEYPGYEPVEETETEIPKKEEEKEIPVEDFDEFVGGMTDKEFEDFIAIPDPFEETGKFQFCHKAIPEYLARQYREQPEILYVAKEMMDAVYNGKTEFDIPPEYELDEEGAFWAESLAKKSCPLADACTFGMDEDGLHYYINYFPKVQFQLDDDGNLADEISDYSLLDQDEAKIMVEDFTDYIQTLIDNNVKAEDSDMEKAEKIFEALTKEISYRERKTGEDQMFFESEEEMVEAWNNQTYLVEDILNDKATTQPRLALLYQYILTQLNIECMTVSSSGLYNNQGIERLDNEMGTRGRNVWNVVVVDGKAYNCDLAFEILTYEYDKSFGADLEPEMKYFGMSDSTRAQTFNISSRSSLFYYDADLWAMESGPMNMVPECVEDYKH